MSAATGGQGGGGAAAAGRAPRERPSPGRAAFLEAKRGATRAAILAAGRRLFAETPYVHATIEDIVRAAAVSRATFYQHFESKLALAVAIYEAMRPEVLALFEALAALDGRDEAAVVGWLRGYVACFRAHAYVVPLLAQLQIFEPAFRARLERERDGFVAALAPDGGADVRMRARLVLEAVTTACGALAESGRLSAADADAYLAAAAEALRHFLVAR